MLYRRAGHQEGHQCPHGAHGRCGVALHSEHTVGLETGAAAVEGSVPEGEMCGAPGGRTPGGGRAGSVGGAGPGAPRHAVRPPAGAEGRLGSGGRPRPRGHLGGLGQDVHGLLGGQSPLVLGSI